MNTSSVVARVSYAFVVHEVIILCLIRIFIAIDGNVAHGHNLFSIGFMREDIKIEISKDFTLFKRIFDQEQRFKC